VTRFDIIAQVEQHNLYYSRPALSIVTINKPGSMMWMGLTHCTDENAYKIMFGRNSSVGEIILKRILKNMRGRGLNSLVALVYKHLNIRESSTACLKVSFS